MPKPSVVKIDDVALTDVGYVEFNYVTPTRDGHFRTARPELGEIKIVRGATASPTVAMFALATNGDGSKKVFAGKITIVDDQNQEIYSVEFRDAFIEDWAMGQSEDSPIGTETLTLRAGWMQFFAGGANETVNFRNYPLA